MTRLLLLLLLTIGVYASLWTAGFVYEDRNYGTAITRPLEGVQDPRLRLAHPRVVTDLSFMLNAWTAPTPRGYHLTNLALHLFVGMLVFVLGRRWGGPEAGLLAAALMLLHPLQTETVAYIASGRSELLAALGVFGALWCAPRRGWRALALTTSCGLLALAAKESAAAGLVLLLPVTAWWQRVPLDRRVWGPVGLWTLALVAIGAAFWVRTPHVWFVGSNALLAWQLLGRVLVPVALSVNHLRPGGVVLEALAIGAWAGLGLFLTPGAPRLVVWLFWGLTAALAPRVLAPQAEPLHEHALYLPVILVSVAVAQAVVARPALWFDRTAFTRLSF